MRHQTAPCGNTKLTSSYKNDARGVCSMMKRKLTILVLCGLVALVAVVFLSSGNGGKRNAGTKGSLVVTQDGKVTLVAQPEGYATFRIIANNPKQGTNSSASTNAQNK